MFGPTRGDDQGAIFVAIATTFVLGAESSRLPACHSTYLSVMDMSKYQAQITD